jgi:dihydrofolate reductase
MKVSLIVAVDEQFGIGKNNDLMWHLPSDMRFFKETTTGHIVVMGRKNYESIPERFRPLPNRENVVLSRWEDFQAPNCKIFSSLQACLERYADETERTVFIIGGGQIYREALDMNCVSELFITQVHHTYDADVFFPKIDFSSWEKTILLEHLVDDKHPVPFTISRYLKQNSHLYSDKDL